MFFLCHTSWWMSEHLSTQTVTVPISRLLLQRLEVWSVCSSMIWLCLNCRLRRVFEYERRQICEVWAHLEEQEGVLFLSNFNIQTYLQFYWCLVAIESTHSLEIVWDGQTKMIHQLFFKFRRISRESKKPPPGTIQECWPNSGPSPQKNLKGLWILKGWWFLHWWSGCTGWLEGVLAFLDRLS